MGNKTMKIRTGALILSMLCSALFTAGAIAADEPARDKLLNGGAFGDFRSNLSEHGVDIGLRLSEYGQRVATGGRDQNTEFGGTMDYRINLDGAKLFGSWDGFSINIHARTRWGKDVNADVGNLALQNTGLLQPAPGDYDGTAVTGLTVSQYLPFFGGLANVTVGKIDVLDAVGFFFDWADGGQEGFWNVNSLVTALPWFGGVQGLSLDGGWFVTVNEKYKQGESGILVLGTQDVSTTSSDFHDSFDDGAWVAAFHRFFWEIDEKMGYFMVFGGYSTKEQASNERRDFVVIPGQGIESTDEENPWDIAVYFYQGFWEAPGNPDRKAHFVIGGTMGPDNPQFAEWNLFAQVEAYGPMDSRPADRMGIGMWYNGLSDNFTDLVEPVADLRDLWGVELYYNFEIEKWLHVTPDIQYIQNEWDDDDNALVLGTRVVVDF